MKYLAMLILFSLFPLKTVFAQLGTVDNESKINFITTLTLEKKEYTRILEAVQVFDINREFYQSVGDDIREDIRSFKIEKFEISSPNIDLNSCPSEMKIKLGYVSDMDTEITWLGVKSLVSSQNLKTGHYNLEYDNELTSFNSQIYRDMLIKDSDIQDTTKSVNRTFNKIFFIARLEYNYPWDIERLDFRIDIKTIMKNDIIIGEML